ncbi:MAG TPA: GWxTD domain-containing protein [Candidatus Polarisedimenticolia bacterium]|nr:GWxTD domain-containing protein [Candidatus Polarisedimenticolia bacterium]
MRVRRWARAALLAVLGLALAAQAAQGARKKTDYLDKPIPQWREGPVRYIITRWEDREYKDLEDQESRARFIENFWRRRDTTPDTPGNEFRAEFWKRVRDANRLYGEETAKEGWRTDMGKIHILRGPPDEINRDLMAQGHRGTVVWVYRTSGETGLGPNVVVAFARDTTGEFRLSTEPSKDADPKQGSPLHYQPPMGTTARAQAQIRLAQERAARLINLTDPLIRQAGGPAAASPLTLQTELVKLQQPPTEWEIRETVLTQEYFGSVPIRARADAFRTTTSKVLVLLTTAVKSSVVHYRRAGGRDVPDVVFYARVMDVTGNDLVLGLDGEGDFKPAAENASAGLDDDLVFQAGALLEPGSYKVLFSVLDREGGKAGSYVFPITVPDLQPAGLTLSSLMLARSIEARPAGSAGAPAAGEPFTIGALRIVPRVTQTFRAGEDLSFYYQVYGAADNPATGKPSLDVDYGFFTLSAEQTQDLGHVTFEKQEHAAHGYALSTQGWPEGPYLLRVSVTDRVSQASASRDLVFEIR